MKYVILMWLHQSFHPSDGPAGRQVILTKCYKYTMIEEKNKYTIQLGQLKKTKLKGIPKFFSHLLLNFFLPFSFGLKECFDN